MKLRKIVAFTAAAAMLVGMAPAALAWNVDVNRGNMSPKYKGVTTYDDGYYVDPVDPIKDEINVGEVRVGTSVNFPKDYKPWDRNPTMADLRYTQNGQAYVPVEVRFAQPKNESIDLNNITVSGAVNGKAVNLVYEKSPAIAYGKTVAEYLFFANSAFVTKSWIDEYGTSYVNAPDLADASTNTGTPTGQFQLVALSKEKLSDAGFAPINTVIYNADGTVADYDRGFTDPDNKLKVSTYAADTYYVGTVVGDSRLQLLRYNGGKWYNDMPNRFAVPDIFVNSTEAHYIAMTVLCPVTTDLMTVTLTGRGTSTGKYFHGSFTVKAKNLGAASLEIASVSKLNVNAANYSLNGFTKNTVTIATNLAAGSELAFEQVLQTSDGKALPTGRYTITGLKATYHGLTTLAPVRSTGYVEDSKLTIYLDVPATGDAYDVTGTLRDAAGNEAYQFSFVYTVTKSSGLYPSEFTVAPNPVNIKVGETKTITATRVTTDIDVTKAEFASKDATVATVAKNAGTNAAVITGVKVGTTVVNVTVPGVTNAYPVIVNVVNAEGTFEESVANLTKMVVRVNTRLNVRSAPSTASKTTIVGKLQNGFIVYMDPAKSSDTWHWITYKTDIGGKSVIVQGYVSARYLDLAD